MAMVTDNLLHVVNVATRTRLAPEGTKYLSGGFLFAALSGRRGKRKDYIYEVVGSAPLYHNAARSGISFNKNQQYIQETEDLV